MRRLSLSRIGAVSVSLLLASCAALPTNNNLLEEYFKATRQLKLTPVYPPREEFQVGDVFFRSYDPAKPNDLASLSRIWIGTLQTVREDANSYLQTRINYNDTGVTGADKTASSAMVIQKDFDAGAVTLNNGTRTTLPAFAFPTISGSASTAGSFGGFEFLRSFGFGLGRSEIVSISFPDVRAFGAPFGGFNPEGRSFDEYRRKICPKADQAVRFAAVKLRMEKEEICQNGRKCDFAVITRTYRTRAIEYTYSSARIAQLAVAEVRGIPSATPEKTLAVPSNVSVEVKVGENVDGTTLAGLINGLAEQGNGGDADTPTSALNFVGIQGNSLKFDRTYQKPVAIAYDSYDYTLNPFSESEISGNHKLEQEFYADQRRTCGQMALVQIKEKKK